MDGKRKAKIVSNDRCLRTDSSVNTHADPSVQKKGLILRGTDMY